MFVCERERARARERERVDHWEAAGVCARERVRVSVREYMCVCVHTHHTHYTSAATTMAGMRARPRQRDLNPKP